MNLDNARNAKAEIFKRAFEFVEKPYEGTLIAAERGGLPTFAPAGQLAEGWGVKLKLSRRDINPVALLAVGIAPPRQGTNSFDDYRIFLFGQRKSLRDLPIVQRAIRAAKGEAEFVHVGPIARQSAWKPPVRRPLVPGISLAHYRVTAGTLGAFVDMGDQGGVCMLSNNHVLADVNRASIGDEILQPGRADGGKRPKDRVGSLHLAIPISLTPDLPNMVDCAVATILPGVKYESGVFADPVTGTSFRLTRNVRTDIELDEEVRKLGRTTGLTNGRIFATEVDNVVVNMGSSQNPKYARFDNQISIYSNTGNFSKGGDSGSLIVDSDHNGLGLLFAGSESGAPSGHGLTFANPLNVVLSELGADLHIS